MTLLEPLWLLLALPLGLAVWLWPVPGRSTLVLRGVVCVLIVLALARLAMVLPGHGATVVVVADRSASMPAHAESLQRELIGSLGRSMRPEDRLGVVSFGRETRVEQSPAHQAFGGFVGQVGPDASNLADGIETALSLVPPGRPGRVIVLSDGRWTGRDLHTTAGRAAGRGVPIDYRLIERRAVNDLAIASLDAPSRVTPEQEFIIGAHLWSPAAQRVRYELQRGGRMIAEGVRQVAAGGTRLTFRDAVSIPGTADYTLRVRGELDDPQPENNTARLLVGVTGQRPILLVTESEAGGLAAVLRGGGLDVTVTRAAGFTGSLAQLGGYDAVILEDVPARDLGHAALAGLAQWVQHAGGGLLKTGGPHAYGAGGYFRGPLDPVLPVSMELQQEHRKHAIAMALVIDRSGSMSGEPLALAREAAMRAVDMLSPMDQVGVIAFDTQPHVVSDLRFVTDPEAIKYDIGRLGSGGGTYMYAGMAAGHDMLRNAETRNRHMIVLGDGMTQEADHLALVDALGRMGATVSTVALGPSADRELLSAIAERGGGRYYETLDATELPELFVQDLEVVARSTFVQQATPVIATAGFRGLLGWSPLQVPAVGGYSLTHLRPGAQLGMRTEDEYQAPVVAAWQAGLGRAIAYTGEADGEFTGPIAQWENVGQLMTSLARWAVGERAADLGRDTVLTQQLDEGLLRVQLHLDPQADAPPLEALPELTILRGYPGQAPEREQATMRYIADDRLGYDVPLHGAETVIVTAAASHVDESRRDSQPRVVTLAPVTLPYPPEFAPVTSRRGVSSLRQLARASGGAERMDMAGVWSQMPLRARRMDLSPYLLLAAALVFLLEVFERRTGRLANLAHVFRRRVRPAEAPPADQAWPVDRPRRRRPQPSVTAVDERESPSVAEGSPTSGTGEAQPATGGAGLLAAMEEARRRARNRTKPGDRT